MSTKADRTIHLAFTAEGTYLPHAAAMIHSVLTHNAEDALALHLLYGADCDVRGVELLQHWLAARGVAFEQHFVSDEHMRGIPRHPAFHRSVWYRLLTPELLPQCSRLLYLDADTIVSESLRPLWETHLSHHLFAAVANPLYPFMDNWPKNLLGVPKSDCYLNSGVLVLDLERMRREGCVATLKQYAKSHPDLRCPEQDALSAVYFRRCRSLHPRWNVQTTLYDLHPKDLPFSAAEVREAREKPAIVHFIGPFKPDHYLCRHPHAGAYAKHRRYTPWPLTRLEGATLENAFVKGLPFAWQVRYFHWRSVAERRLLRRRSTAQ